jgi:hypothetical protein
MLAPAFNARNSIIIRIDPLLPRWAAQAFSVVRQGFLDENGSDSTD